MSNERKSGIVVPEITVYDALKDEDIVLKNINVDRNYVHDKDGKVMYFNADDAGKYLAQQRKTLASLPLLINLYISLDKYSASDESIYGVLQQLNSAWDRTGTSINAGGSIIHNDSILGRTVYNDIRVLQKGGAIVDLFGEELHFFRVLLGIKDIDNLLYVAEKYDMTPFYWYPRGERQAMFGGGEFYYMHQYLSGLLMVFCDDEPHPYRTVRGVWH